MSIQLTFGLTQSFWEFLILTGEGKAAQQGIVEVTHDPWYLSQVYCLDITPPIFTKIEEAWFECCLTVNVLKVILIFVVKTVRPLKMGFTSSAIRALLSPKNGEFYGAVVSCHDNGFLTRGSSAWCPNCLCPNCHFMRQDKGDRCQHLVFGLGLWSWESNKHLLFFVLFCF